MSKHREKTMSWGERIWIALCLTAIAAICWLVITTSI